MKLWVGSSTPPPASTGTVYAVLSVQAFTLEPGHPLRAASCLLCDTAVAGQPVLIYTMVPLDGDRCLCSALHPHCYLIHERHGMPDDLRAWQAVQRRTARGCGEGH